VISIHPESTRHLDRSLSLIRECGCKAGIVFNPATPLDVLDWVIDRIDLVLLMSVNPGFGGQTFIPSALTKLKQARRIIDDSELEIRLEIDGGVKPDNAADIIAAGADTLVAGSAIFGSDDYASVIRALRGQ
jgi:ribulose-phosphate 3-epimerase